MLRPATLLRTALLLFIALVTARVGWAQSSILFSDSFSDGDASDWQTFASGWSEAGGLRLARNTAPNQPVSSVWPLGYGWSDYAVESDVEVLDNYVPSSSALVFRFNTPFPKYDFCRCSLFQGAPNIPGLPSGRYLRLYCPGHDAATPFNFVVGQFYRLRATAVGRTVTCEVVGAPSVPRLVITSDSISCTGTAGLRSTHIPSNYDNFLVTAIDAPPDPSCLTAPIADAGPDQTLEAGQTCAALATLDGSGSIGPRGEDLTFEWSSPLGNATGPDPQYLVPLGSYEFALTVTDSEGQTDSDTTKVTVVDRQAPTIQSVAAEPSALWPPSHRLIPVTISAVAKDNCDSNLSCHVVGVESNEPADGLGDGSTAPDWQIRGPLTVALRAERSGTGSGRVYTVKVECSDASGNTSRAGVEIRVAHDRGH